MKYCPYCGADLLNDEVSFCVECGKQLPGRNTQESKSKPSVTDMDTPTEDRTHGDHCAAEQEQNDAIADPDAGYDGYYDDVRPDDHGNIRSGVDKQLLKKVTVLGISVVLIICACVAIMYIL